MDARVGGLGYEGKNTHERPSEKRQQQQQRDLLHKFEVEKRMNAQSSNNMFTNSAKAETSRQQSTVYKKEITSKTLNVH